MGLVMSSWATLHNFYTNMHDTVVVKEVDILASASDVSGFFILPYVNY
jgi:hypothetical protein